MKLVKSLLLGSVAGVAAVASAQAADLPFRKAAPVEYVRVCDWTGAGFFYIPGTDTCLKVGGIIRAEYAAIENSDAFFPTAGSINTGVTGAAANQVFNAGARVAEGGGAAALAGKQFINGANGNFSGGTGTYINGRNRDLSGFFARGRIDADARTQTAYGTLRTYVRFQIDRLQGNYAGGGKAGGQNTFANQAGNSAYLDKGFIQFAGFTAGRIQSFFDFYADNYNFEGIANSDESNNVFAYTATFGGGFSATISVEDRNGRTDGIGQIFNGSGTGRGVQGTATNTATVGLTGITGATTTFANGNVGYGGEVIPDFVGVLRVDQAWGAAQLSGAYHDVNTTQTLGGTGIGATTTDGFAVQAGIQIKLPMLAAGDDLWIEGAYQEGAYLYQDCCSYANAGFNSLAVGGFQHLDQDAVAYSRNVGGTYAGYNLAKSTGFSVLAAFHHYFTPQFHDVLFGSYEESGYGNVVKNVDWRFGGIGDMSEYRIGNQFIYTPVHNLDIGFEIFYAHIDQTLASNPGDGGAALRAFRTAAPGVSLNPSAFEGRFRVERDF